MRRLYALAVVVGLGLAISGPRAYAGDWTPLGERVVDERALEESIAVRTDGPYKQIKLLVKVNPLKIMNVKVAFRDGTSFDATLDTYVPPGVSTQAIELPAAKPIAKVTFTCKKVGSGVYPPVVRLLGAR